MKRFLVISLLLFLVFVGVSWHNVELSAAENTRAWILQEIENTKAQLLPKAVRKTEVTTLQNSYFVARKHFKHIEFFIEYMSPREAKYFINGPLVPKHDEEYGIRYPQGFQRIEELLFSDSDSLDIISLNQEYLLLIEQLNNLSSYYSNLEISDAQLLDMCQLEFFRISAMNLNGYDATITQNNIVESSWCLEGIETVLNCFEKKDNRLVKQLKSAIKYLQKNSNYNTFNRLHFILNYINPLNASLVRFHNDCQLPWGDRKQAINLQEPFLFGKESFNLAYFSMYYDDKKNLDLQAELGKLLFYDPVLSGNNQRSCASCHNPQKAFTDGFSKSLSSDRENVLNRNAPTLLNVIYQKAFFHDGRAYQLEQQIFDVVHNQNEMQSSLDEVMEKLKQSAEYRALFSQAYAGTIDTVITAYAIQKAITEYEKTLLSWNSKFDKHIRGNSKILNEREINGYTIFAGKALCGSCHFFPLFNGTVPPFYNDSEFEVIGVSADSSNTKLDADIGRIAITKKIEHLHSFKTPTLRNIEYTAPYMHNGAYNNLEQIVEFYHRGGGKGFLFSLPNQTLPFDSLQLNKKEKEDIVLFMKTLSDTSEISRAPKRLPFFENQQLNNRKIGGIY